MTSKLIEEMEELRTRCVNFIRDTSTPIKKQHSDNVEKYLERFIKFPGALSVVSVFFTSSNLVKNTDLAISGMVFIVASLLIALNIFRKQINIDKDFYYEIIESEKPMVKFSRSFTLYSREGKKQNEDQLINDFSVLVGSYEKNITEGDEAEDVKNFNSLYKHLNFSFWLLVGGVILSFLSIISC